MSFVSTKAELEMESKNNDNNVVTQIEMTNNDDNKEDSKHDSSDDNKDDIKEDIKDDIKQDINAKMPNILLKISSKISGKKGEVSFIHETDQKYQDMDQKISEINQINNDRNKAIEIANDQEYYNRITKGNVVLSYAESNEINDATIAKQVMGNEIDKAKITKGEVVHETQGGFD
eukprot:CAMPEP_0114662504 /NCGR_PEP_ID=MMETSP0191-20121206/24960_1 /TAXON_ID=126664 /ORGANISM="Sorites sp." /LENGTH=174 /DNA_ID=CAMNT_0001898885 /DNA_START=414 /DNA_END=938 /DNA_ORIENTATION=+